MNTLATTPTSQSVGFPGHIADSTPAVIDTKQNESATAIDYGIVVVQGASGGTVKPMTADADVVVGISIADPTMMNADPATNVANFARYRELGVMKIGRVFAVAAEDVRDGDQVIIVTAGAAVNTTCFASSKGGVATTGRVAYKGAKWRCQPGASSLVITAGTVGIIELIDQNLGRATT
jgi:hypothetical protein